MPADYEMHRGALRNFREQFPDLSAVTDAYIDNGEYGAAATTWNGTYSGMVCGKKSVEPSTWIVNYIFRVENDRIVVLWEIWDEGGLLGKRGIAPGSIDAQPLSMRYDVSLVCIKRTLGLARSGGHHE